MNLEKEDLIEDLKSFGGVIAPVAKKHGVTWQAVWKRIKKDPDIEEAFTHAREVLKDKAIFKLGEALDNNQRWAIEKVLDRLCHDRGFTDSKHVVVSTKPNEGQEEISKRINKIKNMPTATLEQRLLIKSKKFDKEQGNSDKKDGKKNRKKSA